MALTSTASLLTSFTPPKTIQETLKRKDFKSEEDRAQFLIAQVKNLTLERANDQYGRTPMMLAAKWGRVVCMRKLHAEFGAHALKGAEKHMDPLINDQSHSGKFALTYAVQADRLEAAIFLCKHDAYVNKWNLPPIYPLEGAYLESAYIPAGGYHSESPPFSYHNLSEATDMTTMGYAISTGKLSYIALLLEHEGNVCFHLQELEQLLKKNEDHPLHTYCMNHLKEKWKDKNYYTKTRSGDSLKSFHNLIRAAHKFELQKKKAFALEKTTKTTDEKIAPTPTMHIDVEKSSDIIPISSPRSNVAPLNEEKTPGGKISAPTKLGSPKMGRISPKAKNPRTPPSVKGGTPLPVIPEKETVVVEFPSIPLFVDAKTAAEMKLLIEFSIYRPASPNTSEIPLLSESNKLIAAV